MFDISWNKDGYSINGKPDFLISGEFQYFRVPKNDWSKRLDLLIEAGGNCVATYVPWVLHEPVEGDFKIGDEPYRDLEGFLDLCKEKGLPVIARPGPYQYSEMKHCGLPHWLCRDYPEIIALDINGEKTMMECSVSYLHPVFLEKTKKWFDFICPILAKYTVSKNGPILYMQFDNELIGVHEWFGGWDYHPVGMGIGGEENRYARFLKKKYEDISALNMAYESDYPSFGEIKPWPKATPVKDKDYRDFYLANIAEYSLILAEWMREYGIDCDLVHNSANPGMNPYFLETVTALGEGFLLGSDLYYNLNMDFEANNPTPKYFIKGLICHDELRLMGFPSTIYEMQSGSAAEWPPILAEDLKCWYLSNIAAGMKGVNYYVFTGGPNPENISGDGHVYDYGAGIAADGTIRPIYHMQKEFGAFLHDNAWLSRSERVSDFYLGLDWEKARSKDETWEFMQKGIMITSLCSSFMPEFVCLNGDLSDYIDKPLLIAGDQCMDGGIQKKLVDYVKGGGDLCLISMMPELDENFAPCTILADFIGTQTESFRVPDMDISLDDVSGLICRTWKCDRIPDGAEAFAFDKNSGQVLGWQAKYENGTITWLGMRWRHDKLVLNEMMRNLFRRLGPESPVVACDNPNIWTVLRSDGEKRMLFIMNLFSSPLEAGIKIREADGSFTDTGKHRLQAMEVKTVSL